MCVLSGKAVLVLGLVSLSILVSQVAAQSVSTQVPELPYNPTLQQLISDWRLNQQMTVLDLRVSSNSPVAARAAIGYDANNMDFILDYVSQTSLSIPAAFINVGVDRINEASRTPTSETFLIICVWVPSSNERRAGWYPGYSSGGFSGFAQSITPPSGFAWTSLFTKTYLNQQQDHVVFAAQIPNSAIGPGNAEGKYGIYLSMGLDNETQVPGYPPNAEYSSPQTYAAFTTQHPISEFNPATELITGVALLIVVAIMKMNRSRVPLHGQ